MVHLIRAAMRFVNWRDPQGCRRGVETDLPSRRAEAARIELEAFKASELGRKNPHTVAVFENAWERFTPFLAFPPMLRRVIYTTNSIESLNYQLRKIIKNRGHFPRFTCAGCVPHHPKRYETGWRGFGAFSSCHASRSWQGLILV